MLTALEIQTQIRLGNIKIEPYYENQLGTNSYDLHLGRNMKYLLPDVHIDPKKDISDYYADMPIFKNDKGEEYYELLPYNLYLGVTAEYTETRGFIPIMEGKSSLARMGISPHFTAGFGDNGFCGHWTLEITVMNPTRLYVGMPIGQIVYHAPYGEREGHLYDERTYDKIGSYNNKEATPGIPNLWQKWEKCTIKVP